ncbi:unnamed protein product [Blepharisma stoltei]|uniref:Tetratricopeptide repeat protein n=1 Tax=Blepharisma stoltei TaxID=1481888 RepID=A0AAU9KAS5_9CILI|nr:unnamed protein product [Blepharisma stoltei]
MGKKCFEPECMNEVEHACKCSSPDTLLCGEHIGEHVNLPNRAHNLESIFMQPYEGTKEAILEFLTKEKSKYSELKSKIIDSYIHNSEKDFGNFTIKLDCYSDEINDFFVKISQTQKLLKSEEDPILGLLSLQPQEAIEKVKLMIIASRYWYNGAKLFYIFKQKLNSLNRSFFTEICGAHLEKRNMQNTPEMDNKIRKPTSIESANAKDSISLIINENSDSLKEPENANKPIKNTPENKLSLLNSQISSDFNSKPKETESALSFIDILRNKTAEILSRPNNQELEMDFRRTCSAYQDNSSFYDPLRMQAYQDYIKAYILKTSLYNIPRNQNNRTNLIIYNTETETLEVKTLQTPKPLNKFACITQLPNGKLFCCANTNLSGITVLIDVNGRFEVLPSGTPCEYSSYIYFNNSVYCFGGWDRGHLTLSSRFDLDQNRWIQLAPMPQGDYKCNSIILNRNILISGYENRNLWLYSIDIDSFSTIPYDFGFAKWKILINAERLYLIECENGLIYEGEIGSFSNWRRIGRSKINLDPYQVYCSYNKGGIWISAIYNSAIEHYYFNLDQKKLIDAAYYNKHILLRRVGQKIEAIKCNNQDFNLDPSYLDECNSKDIALSTLGENLTEINCLDKKIKLNPSNANSYNDKGNAFYVLQRYLEAIECYDKAIKLNPDNGYLYNNKGNAFSRLKRYHKAIKCYDEAIKLNPNALLWNNKGIVFYDLEKYLEAIESFDEAIKLDPNNVYYYNNKGNAFYDLQRYIEAIECFDKALEIWPNYDNDIYWKKGSALYKLRRYPEAVESYSKAIKINPNNTKYYNDKGNTHYVLERYQEAMQCYEEAIILEPNNPLHFYNRVIAFNNLRQEQAALQDFNRAYNLKQENQVYMYKFPMVNF